MIQMFITKKTATFSWVSLFIYLFLKLASYLKVCQPLEDSAARQNREQNNPVCISKELHVVLTLIN